MRSMALPLRQRKGEKKVFHLQFTLDGFLGEPDTFHPAIDPNHGNRLLRSVAVVTALIQKSKRITANWNVDFMAASLNQGLASCRSLSNTLVTLSGPSPGLPYLTLR